jgi:hypothetical protein
VPVELSVLEAAFTLTMVGLGALIQGSLGFGFAFAVAPALALVQLEAVPATIVLLAIPLLVRKWLRSPAGPDSRSPGARASEEVWRVRWIIGIFLALLSATRLAFPDAFIRKGAPATACSSPESRTGPES